MDALPKNSIVIGKPYSLYEANKRLAWNIALSFAALIGFILVLYKGRNVSVAAIRDVSRQKNAEEEIKTLRGILPICSFCKKIRDDKGYWEQVDIYIHKHSEADISHGICPECMKKHYPEQYAALFKGSGNK
jgi:hypothetical protein